MYSLTSSRKEMKRDREPNDINFVYSGVMTNFNTKTVNEFESLMYNSININKVLLESFRYFSVMKKICERTNV